MTNNTIMAITLTSLSVMACNGHDNSSQHQQQTQPLSVPQESASAMERKAIIDPETGQLTSDPNATDHYPAESQHPTPRKPIEIEQMPDGTVRAKGPFMMDREDNER